MIPKNSLEQSKSQEFLRILENSWESWRHHNVVTRGHGLFFPAGFVKSAMFWDKDMYAWL